MEGFRSLAEGELVEFEAKPSDRGFEATFVCGPGGADCKGSERRPVGKRKTRKIRLVYRSVMKLCSLLLVTTL